MSQVGPGTHLELGTAGNRASREAGQSDGELLLTVTAHLSLAAERSSGVHSQLHTRCVSRVSGAPGPGPHPTRG